MTRPPGSVQSVVKALDLLEALGAAGGELGLSELSAEVGLPLPTIHRLIRTLVARGFVRQLPNRRYALGAALMPLGEVARSMLSEWAEPVLKGIVDALGETANLAVLDGDRVTYVAQAPSRYSMRMFTEVGRQVYPHSTGVGKALLAELDDDVVRSLLSRTGMPAETGNTITDPDVLVAELAHVREVGYALEEGEQELGVRCIAVPLPRTQMSVSISGPASRLTSDLVSRSVPVLSAAAAELADQLVDHSIAKSVTGADRTRSTRPAALGAPPRVDDAS